MDVTCEKCQTEYEFDDALVSEQGTSVRCTQCGHRFRVKREAGAGAPEIWIVRTVEGRALEFRALRELKVAISAGKVCRDDVLSRGSGRPRRLASIAELEPFFVTQSPRPMFSTSPGLGADEEPRARTHTPHGLGPAQGKGERNEHSVAIPLPRDPGDGPAAHAQSFDEDETTAVQNRRATRELHTLGEVAPVSMEPATLPDPPKHDQAPRTVMGLAPPAAPLQELQKTASFGTPVSSSRSRADADLATTQKRSAKEIPAADRGKTPPKTPSPDAVAAPKSAKPSAPQPASVAKENQPAPGLAAEPSPASKPRVASNPPPAPKAPPVSGAPAAAKPASSMGSEAVPAPVAVEDEGLADAAPQRQSRLTPTPASTRYSHYDEDAEVVPSGQRTSGASSRRPSNSLRLVVGLLLGGALAFVGVVLVQKYFPKQGSSGASFDEAKLSELVELGERRLRDGDIEGAKEQIDKASLLGEAHPRVLRAQARLAVVRADSAWLEFRILSLDDPGREAVRRQLRDAADTAQKATDRASESAKEDPEVVRLRVDVRRLMGDLAGARKLAADLAAISSQGETALTLGALDLAEAQPPFASIIERLSKAADDEGGLGRARALLVYALARSGDLPRAQNELDRLSKLPKAHPLEPGLRRYLERVEKGENPAAAAAASIDDLPPASSASGATAVDGGTGSATSLGLARDAAGRGQLDKAEQIYQGIVDREPNNTEALAGLAAVARSRGQSKRAVAIYQRVVDQNPGYMPGVIALADLKYDSGDRAGAATLYRRALDGGVSGESAARARSRTQAAPGETTPTGTAEVPTGTAAPPTTGEPPPSPATSGGSDIPPFEGDSL